MIARPSLARLIATMQRSYLATHALETTSPRERPVLVRERARRTIRPEQRKSHWLTSALLDGPRACIVVEIRLGIARTSGVDFDPGRLELDRHGEAGSAFLVSEPTPLDTLTIRAAGASRSSGSIAWVTARTPNTLVSHTARISARGTLLGRVNLAYSCTDMPGCLLVFEIAALFTSTSRCPSSFRMRSAAAAIEA